MRLHWIILLIATAGVVAVVLALGPRLMQPGTSTDQQSWPGPVDAVAVISTRGHFTDDELTPGHTDYDYDITDTIAGMGPDDPQPYDMLVVIHGFNNDDDEARYKFDLARESLHRNSYNGALVGFSWDADTPADPLAADGFHAADTQAALNGAKLARFLLDYRKECSATRLHLVGYSLGARVALECLYALESDRSLRDDRFKLSSVHLVGAAIENEEVELTERYGQAIQNRTQRFINYYSPGDNMLAILFPVTESYRALGSTDIEHGENKPHNYESFDVTTELVTCDIGDEVSRQDLGDNHSGYLGNRSPDGALLSDGVMDLIVRDILKREE